MGVLSDYLRSRDLWCIQIPDGKEDEPWHTRVLEFSRKPVPSDFTRLRKYGSLVRSVELTMGERQIGFNFTAHELLHSLFICGPKPLFPNLRSLKYHQHGAQKVYNLDWAQFDSLFLHPSLNSVSITLVELQSDAALVACLDYLASSAPHLTTLEIVEGQRYLTTERCNGPKTTFSPSFHLLAHLREVHTGNHLILPEALRLIGSIRGLEQLSICAQTSDYAWDVIPTDGGRDMFPSLKTLELHTDDFLLTAAILDLVASSAVTHVTLSQEIFLDGKHNKHYSCLHDIPLALLHELFQAIGRHTSIVELVVSSVARLDGPQDLSELFPLLYPLTSLRILQISGWELPVINNATLDGISCAWPALEQLELTSREERDEDYKVVHDNAFARATPFGLVPLATRCPHLRSLVVPVDTSGEIYPPHVLREGGGRGTPMRPVDSHLTRLDIGPYSERKPPRFPEQLASLASTIFPGVLEFGPEKHLRGEAWRRVDYFIIELLEMRESERAYWAAQRGIKRSEPYFEFEF